MKRIEGSDMTSIGVKQKALIYLNKYRSLDSSDVYNTPWELTQDGVANALCISRAHASIVLHQLKDEDLVEEKVTHIRNGKIRRKSYFILPTGMDEATKLLEMAKKEDVDLSFILDSKKLGTNVSIDRLSGSDRFALGCACAFSNPMKMSALPQFKNLSVPVDISGYVLIENDLRESMMGSATEDERASWHGYAANYWFERKIRKENDYHECIHELLYHYVESGRNRDACKLISTELFYFVNSIDDEVHDSVIKVRPVERYAKDVLILSVNARLEYGEIDDAEKAAEELKRMDIGCASAYIFDICMLRGDRIAAEKAIADTWQSNPMAGVRKASLLRDDGRFDDARKVLMDTRWDLYDENFSNFELEKFVELARIDYAEGRYDDAYQHLSKTRYIINDAKYGRKYLDLEKELRKKLNI